MIRSNPNEPTFIFDSLPLHWQMTRCEKYAFASLVEVAKPEIAIEVGTYKGGSLQVIAKTAKKVYSIDSSPECKNALGERFTNVEFLTGDSKQLLPSLLSRISAQNESLGFVLIDGDHSTEGVRNDIDAVLQYTPTRPLFVVFHDSFQERDS
jgi:predicted O-methyltransferase YrrM